MISTQLIYAGRLERVLANLIDTIILLIPSAITATVLGEASLGVLVMFLCNLGYYTAFNSSRWQATPGKRLLNIYIIRLNGRPLGQVEAMERYIAFTLPSLPIYLSFLSENTATMMVVWLSLLWFLPIIFRDDRAGMHDRICDTRVVVGKVD